MNNEKIELNFELNEITNQCLFHIEETINIIKHIYYAVNQDETNIQKPLPTDSFPMMIKTNKKDISIEEQRVLTIQWAINKAFEELISGMTKSLKKTYEYLRIYNLIEKFNHKITREDFEKELQQIESEVDKLHFPDFINKIENILNKELSFKEEILSINQIRNCLVHRYGNVGKKDIRNAKSEELRLKWNQLCFFALINGKRTKITYEIRKSSIIVQNIEAELVKKEKIFRINDDIIIDINDFNGIAYTCAEFAKSLFSIVPRPN